MGKNKENLTSRVSNWFKGLKSEFRKITWPDKKSLVRKSVAVIISAIILGAIISGIDFIVVKGLELIVG